jgi:hypothetical protein
MAGISLSISANASGATATLQGFEKNALGLAKRIQVGFAERVGHRLFDGLMRAAASLPNAMKSAIDAGGKLSDQMARTGAAGEGLVILERALTNAGIAADRGVTLIGQMQRSIAGLNEENQSTAVAFGELGLSMEALRSMDPVQALESIGKAIAGISDPAQRAAVSLRIFGRAGTEALTLFSDGNAFSEAGKQLGQLPGVLAANAEQLDAVSDRLGNLGTGWQQVGAAVAVGILPALDKLTASISALDLTGLGSAIGAVLGAMVKLWPVLLGVGMAMAGMKVASVVNAFRMKIAAVTAATAATTAHTGAANANAAAMTKQAGSAKLAAASMGALALAMIAAQVIISREMNKAAALDAMVEGIERGNAALKKFDISGIQSTAANRLEIAQAVKEIQDEKAAVQAAAEEQILRTDSREAREALRKDLDATLAILDGYASKLNRTTDEQLAANAAKREAAQAELDYQRRLEESTEKFAEAQEKFRDAQADAEKRRIDSLPILAQIDELEKAERKLRGSFGRALAGVADGLTAAELARRVESRDEDGDKASDIEAVTELLKLEEKRAELTARAAKEEADRLAKVKAAAVEYAAEVASLRAQIDGNDQLLRQLEKEAFIREKIAELMAAGLDAVTAQDRAEKLSQLMDRAKIAEAGRIALDALLEAEAIVAGRDPAAGKRSKELQKEFGISEEDADAIAENEQRLEDIRELEDRKQRLDGMDAPGPMASSMARIGGGAGEVFSAGLDYDRQIADLSRQQVQLLQELVATNTRIFEG